MNDRIPTEPLLAHAAENASVQILLLHAQVGESIPRILYANPEVQNATGHLPADLIGRPISVFHGPETDLAVFAAFRDGVRGGETRRVRALEYRKDGTTFWVEIANRRVGDHPDGGAIVMSVRHNVDAEMRLRFMVDACSDVISRHDSAGRFTYVSPSCAHVLGYSPKELLGTRLSDYIHAEDLIRLDDAPRADDVYESTYRLRRKDGSYVWVEARGRIVRNAGDAAAIRETHLLTRDVSRRMRAESDLRESERRYRGLFEASPIAMWIYDPESLRLLAVNKQAIDQYGYSEDEFVAMKLSDVRPQDDVPRMLTRMSERTAPFEDHGIWKHRRKDGALIDVNVTSSDIEWGGKPARLALLRDVTQKKEAEDRLSFLAHFDTLTGLPNRVLLLDRLDQSIASASRNNKLVAVLFMDLDQFKQINDCLGHTSGDEVLRDVASRLREGLRDGDTLCRYSGDEFIIVLNDITALDDVAAFANRVLERLASPFVVEGREVTTTASIGISVYPNDGKEIETLVRQADVAMYQAKTEGRNAFRFYQPAMQEAVSLRLVLQNDLRRAIERQEFVLHYQPILDLKTGKTIAAEALVRWNHPQRGLLSPAEFVGIAEETGLIVPIGKWVLERACLDVAEWKATAGADIDICVNVAPRQFRRFELIDEVADALVGAGIEPKRLRLEITESLLIDNDLQALDIMTRLKSTGVRIELDDFGTGYSSLGRIGAFPIDGLKIDRSFVGKIGHDEHSRLVARAIIGLAQSLGLGIIAEGIETADQVGLLTEFGCTLGQGHFFSPAVTAQEFGLWFARHESDGLTRGSSPKHRKRGSFQQPIEGFAARPAVNG
jgi:diguanylate cyclase (GGDEF)-like protein/PAS domain S-box-containing protein